MPATRTQPRRAFEAIAGRIEMQATSASTTARENEARETTSADVVVAYTDVAGAESHAESGDSRSALALPVRSRSELESLLRRLHSQPAIRHLVLRGEDAAAAGEALVELWRDGLGAEGRLPSGRGTLSSGLDADVIETLRARIDLEDLRDESPSVVASRVAAIPPAAAALAEAPTGDSHTIPEPLVPERPVFLSRKTSFPIFSSDVPDSWLQLLNLVLRIGSDKQDAEGRRFAEALNAVVTIETPVLEDGDSYVPEAFPYFLDIRPEDFEQRFLPRYMEQLAERGALTQLDAVCEQLKASPDSRSGTVVLSGASDGPSLLSATFNTTDGKLYGTFVVPHLDVYGAWPLEAMALVKLQRETAERLGLEDGSSTFVIHSAGLLESDWERSFRVLGEAFQRPLPLHVDPSGVFLFGSDSGAARAMLLNHDASKIQWEEAFSNPEDLSWYIVDVMPWLLPQHIRYVGQECASLMRAMQEKECYLQG